MLWKFRSVISYNVFMDFSLYDFFWVVCCYWCLLVCLVASVIVYFSYAHVYAPLWIKLRVSDSVATVNVFCVQRVLCRHDKKKATVVNQWLIEFHCYAYFLSRTAFLVSASLGEQGLRIPNEFKSIPCFFCLRLSMWWNKQFHRHGADMVLKVVIVAFLLLCVFMIAQDWITYAIGV